MSEPDFRPTEVSSSEFVTSLTHFFRGEMNRANTWRMRLDTTTNWAIITSAAFLSFGFGSREIPHFVIIVATIFVLSFLVIEARRYKYFDLWRWRVALVEENFFAAILTPDKPPLHKNWREMLSEDLQHPRFKISFAEAFGRRLRRNYGWIYLVLLVCWCAKIAIHPTPIEHISDVLQRANIVHLVPGWLVLALGFLFYTGLAAVAVITLKPREEVVRIYPAEKSKIKITNI